MAANAESAALMLPGGPLRRSECITGLRGNATVPVPNLHYAESVARRFRVLKIATWIAASVCAVFAIVGPFSGVGIWRGVILNIVPAVIFAVIPLLRRFGGFAAPVIFFCCAYVTIFDACWYVGTGSGLQFYFPVSGTLAVLLLGIAHIVLASTLVAVAVALTVTLQILVPNNTGVESASVLTVGFVLNLVAASVMAVATVWFALREIARAEEIIELEYQRSESLLGNILPASIAARLKNPGTNLIADKYDDASILFADIAGFTRRASDTAPADLVQFLNQLYTDLDRLVDNHGLEKVKTSGDSYMVVSGVPQPRPDHLDALASLALDVADSVAGLHDPQGRPVPLRIGLAAGPVVAGVVGARKFFYDVWGDAVNLASRMESTNLEGRIQVPQDAYERLKHAFEFVGAGRCRRQRQGRDAYLVSGGTPECRCPPCCRGGQMITSPRIAIIGAGMSRTQRLRTGHRVRRRRTTVNVAVSAGNSGLTATHVHM